MSDEKKPHVLEASLTLKPSKELLKQVASDKEKSKTINLLASEQEELAKKLLGE